MLSRIAVLALSLSIAGATEDFLVEPDNVLIQLEDETDAFSDAACQDKTGKLPAGTIARQISQTDRSVQIQISRKHEYFIRSATKLRRFSVKRQRNGGSISGSAPSLPRGTLAPKPGIVAPAPRPGNPTIIPRDPSITVSSRDRTRDILEIPPEILMRLPILPDGSGRFVVTEDDLREVVTKNDLLRGRYLRGHEFKFDLPERNSTGLPEFRDLRGGGPSGGFDGAGGGLGGGR